MKFADYSLRQLLDDGVPLEKIQKAFDEFECSRNEDVEHFLKDYAIANECIGASRSYLYMDKAAMEKGDLNLIAFFTLAITTTDYSGISNRKKRKIMGDYPRVSKEDRFPGFLLAQIARDDRFKKKDLDCSNLLGLAEGMIEEAATNVGGNVIYLDCIEDLVDYYQGFGYELLPEATEDPDDEEGGDEEPRGFFKMFKVLPRITLQEN